MNIVSYSPHNLYTLPEDVLNKIVYDQAFNANPEQEARYKDLLNLSCVNKGSSHK